MGKNSQNLFNQSQESYILSEELQHQIFGRLNQEFPTESSILGVPNDFDKTEQSQNILYLQIESKPQELLQSSCKILRKIRKKIQKQKQIKRKNQNDNQKKKRVGLKRGVKGQNKSNRVLAHQRQQLPFLVYYCVNQANLKENFNQKGVQIFKRLQDIQCKHLKQTMNILCDMENQKSQSSFKNVFDFILNQLKIADFEKWGFQEQQYKYAINYTSRAYQLFPKKESIVREAKFRVQAKNEKYKNSNQIRC